MIVDREGDLVVTEDGSLMLDVGGFLMKPTPEEIHARSDWVYALMVRRGQRMVPADPPPASFQAAWIEPPPEIFPSLARAEPEVLVLPLPVGWQGENLEPVGEDWDGTLKPLKDLMTAPDCRNPPMCRCRVLPWVNIPVVQFMPGEPLPAAVTSPSLELTEPQQLDSCTGR